MATSGQPGSSRAGPKSGSETASVDNAHVGQSLQHHERVVRSTAQHLRPREQVHQPGIVPGPGLKGTPGEIVEAFVLAPRGCVERQLSALLPVAAGRGLLALDHRQERSDEQEGQEHVAQWMDVRLT